MIARIAIRRDTTANWVAANPVLADGEPALDTTSDTVKYGDGVSRWSALPVSGVGADNPLLVEHLADETPHPTYDDIPSLTLLFENGLI